MKIKYLAVLFAFVFITGFGDGDSTPAYDATGQWTVTTSEFRLVKGECVLDVKLPQPAVETVDVVQDGDTYKSTGEDGEEVEGKVSGAVYTYVQEERVTNDAGDLVDVVVSMVVTLSSAKSFSGKLTMELVTVETGSKCVFEQGVTGEKN